MYHPFSREVAMATNQQPQPSRRHDGMYMYGCCHISIEKSAAENAEFMKRKTACLAQSTQHSNRSVLDRIVANSDFMKSHRRIPSSLQREPLHSKLKLGYILYNEQNGRELKFAQRQGLVHVRETTGIPTSFIAGSGILDPVPRSGVHRAREF